MEIELRIKLTNKEDFERVIDLLGIIEDNIEWLNDDSEVYIRTDKQPPEESESTKEERQAAAQTGISTKAKYAYQLIDKGWRVRGPFNYGSFTREPRPQGLRLQEPESRYHKVVVLPLEELERIIRYAKSKDLYASRWQTDTGPEPAQPKEQAAASTPDASNGPATAYGKPVERANLVCLKCKNPIGSFPLSRFADAVKRQLKAQHLDDTGHDGPYSA